MKGAVFEQERVVGTTYIYIYILQKDILRTDFVNMVDVMHSCYKKKSNYFFFHLTINLS